MNKAVVATIVFLLAFVGVVVYLSTRAAPVECEVCLTYDGQSVCRKAASGTREAAVRSAVTSACGTLAGGMTDTIRCENTPPDRTTCSGG
jgi:hypothetical protein